jgi:uncharacterized protein (TIGR03000 family)
MMTLVLAVALTATTSAPDFGLKGCYGGYGCAGCYGCNGCHGCYGCYGGYVYAKPVYSGCWGGSGCFGGCFGGCYGGGYGCCGGCCGGCYGGCYGCWGGHHVAYAGCGCCGGMVYAPTYSHAPSYGCCGAVIPHAGPPVKVIEKAPGAPGMKKIEGGKDEKGEKGDKKIEGDETAARVIIRAAADVAVTVNGVRLPRKSETETFRTPTLAPGTDYTYTVVATAKRGSRDVTETRRVPVVAGGRAEVDFTALGAASTAAKVTIVADKDMAVRFNGRTIVVEGKRTFDTPELEPGRSYFYTVEADVTKDGKTSTQKRRVEVEAGKSVTVDLSTATTVAAR